MNLPTMSPVRHSGGLPANVISHASGGRDRWSLPLESEPSDPTSAAWNCLREVLDPEIPISLVDLGLIYGLSIEDRIATVDVTFTATACPCMAFIREDLSDRLTSEPWIEEVRIREVWDPPWTVGRISVEGREQLKRIGVGI